MEKANNQTLDGNDSQQNEKTFTKLQRIQSLLKKESALKKLCKNLFILLINLLSIIYSYIAKRSNKKGNREAM